MKLIQETFLETDWEDEETARAARDARAEQLQSQGLVCRREDLYNVLGYRVFLVEATEVEPIAAIVARNSGSSTPKRVQRKNLDYEER